MGFLHISEPLSWEESLQHLRFVREHGLEQFLSVLRRCQHIEADPFKWGDEVEHGIFKLVGNDEDASRTVKVLLRSPEVLAQLQALETKIEEERGPLKAHESATWMPEFGSWMLESTPGGPMEGLSGIGDLEASLRLRRQRLSAALQPGEVAPTVTSMPLFGASNFSEPAFEPRGPAADSLFVPDEAMFPHPRFPTLTKNIRERRGDRVAIRRPRYNPNRQPGSGDAVIDAADIRGPVPTSVAEADALDHVYADAMAFGMGSCCLQVTMQAKNLSESRHLYDQLVPLTGVMLALTAASPFLRGLICDDDTRWGTISQSVDDRTDAERGLASDAQGDERLAGRGVRQLKKSRYDSIDCYIGESDEATKANDLPVVYDQEFFDKLRNNGVDANLAQHIAHLFNRDPLVMFGDRMDLDDERDVDHWENLQSTNWQTLRFKPPPPEKGALPSDAAKHIGWRVEFRSMEVQPTDFENAAFTAFIIAISRAILDLKLNLYLPMSKVEENMRRAQRRSAATAEKFWFRTRVLPQDSSEEVDESELYAEMTVHEILMGGSNNSFPGLVPLLTQYLSEGDLDDKTCSALRTYLPFIVARAEGSLITPATFMRNFVLQHESYQQDGRVPPAAAHDLVVAMDEIGQGLRCAPSLVGESNSPLSSSETLSPEGSPLTRCSASCRRPCSPSCMAYMNMACRC
mmetsp:Transcript_43278/g.92623  ORF Transcript_43278/g.92623 Transcript_43278/m.92623 type:complete len:689 (-) Transcript_43278:326-2392(-)